MTRPPRSRSREQKLFYPVGGNDPSKDCAARGFTLIELLVVVAIIAVLAALLLPVLGRAKFRAKVVNCTSQYRQWGVVASLYAGDNKEFLPSFDLGGTGGNVWDVSSDMPGALEPYGLTVPLWYCPVRPKEYDAANTWAVANLHRPISSIGDLTAYMDNIFGYFALMNHDWWVPRHNGGTLMPTPESGMARLPDGWPVKTTDPSAAVQPIISDLTGHVTSTPNVLVPADGAHFYNNNLNSVNTTYADGHTVTVPKSQIQWQYQNGNWTMFY